MSASAVPPHPAIALPASIDALLRRAPLIDGHNDLPFVIWNDATAQGDVRRYDLARRHPTGDTDLPRLHEGRVGTQIFTAFIRSDAAARAHPAQARRTRLDVIDVMLQIEQIHRDAFHPVLEPDDLDRASSAGKIGLFKAVEGLVGVERLADLRLLHAMGIRLVTLCHNETLPFVDSATDLPGATPLSAFGREIVAEMNRLGLLIDLAHVSPAAQHAVLDATRDPVVNSHANARALCDHPRNAPDDVIRRIAEGGGITMATFVPAFLSQAVYDRLKPTMDGFGKMNENLDRATYRSAKEAAFALFARDGVHWLADHLEYLRNIAGEDGIGIGSDFYGGPNPPGLEDCSRFPAIFVELEKRGWSERAMEKLARRNFERVWRATYKAAPVL